MKNNASYLGTVQDVHGATVSIVLDNNTISGMTFIDGHGYRIGQVGSFVRILIGFIDLFGIVSEVGAGAAPVNASGQEPYGHRWLRVQLIGESRGKGNFNRGITQYPTIGDEAHLVTEDDLAKIYGSNSTQSHVRIGNIASAESIPALVDINKLVSRHSAVVGTTGSGKSTTIANILSTLSDPSKFPSSRIIVFDIHGEYATALSNVANVYKINPDTTRDEQQLQIPYWALSFDELIQLLPFKNASDTDKSIIADRIREMKISSLSVNAPVGVEADKVTVDTPLPFSIHQLWYNLHNELFSTHTAQKDAQNQNTIAYQSDQAGQLLKGDALSVTPPRYLPATPGGTNRIFLSGSTLNLKRPVQGLQSLLNDSRYDFLFRPGEWCPQPTGQTTNDLDSLLRNWMGGERPITILDLSGVPVSILTDLIGAILRILYDTIFWSRFTSVGGRARPLLVVLEEAHSYLSPGNTSNASTSVRRIVKEGRKYGICSMIVSQRPSEVDPTILSQCGSIISLRLTNPSDRANVTSAASDNLDGLFSMLPSLRTGEAIIVGEAVKMPIRTMIDNVPVHRRPDSNDPLVYDKSGQTGWNIQRLPESYSHAISLWRSENARQTATQEVEHGPNPS